VPKIGGRRVVLMPSKAAIVIDSPYHVKSRIRFLNIQEFVRVVEEGRVRSWFWCTSTPVEEQCRQFRSALPIDPWARSW